MRIFYDTNVILSATLFRGRVADLHVAILQAGHEPITSSRVVAELIEVLKRKVAPTSPERAAAIIRRVLVEWACLPATEGPPSVSVRDPDDEGVLADAESMEADYLITGDKDLLSVSDQVKTLRVLSPAEFREVLDEVS